MMLDQDIVAVSPSSVWRVLGQAGLLAKWNGKASKKGTGFEQPPYPHQHWHIDVSYINIRGTFYYLCSVLDGYSRAIVHWDLRESMTEAEIEIILQGAKEKRSRQRESRAKMIEPGKTEAGSAGMHPCRGIAWWAHRDDVHERGSSPCAPVPKRIGSVDPDALKIPARRAEYSLTENPPSPFHAEPAHSSWSVTSLWTCANAFSALLLENAFRTMVGIVLIRWNQAALSTSATVTHDSLRSSCTT